MQKKENKSLLSKAVSGMRNDADFHVRSPRGGRFSSLPSSFRTFSNYLRSVSANASSIAASTVRQAAVSAASSGSLNEDDRQREQVLPSSSYCVEYKETDKCWKVPWDFFFFLQLWLFNFRVSPSYFCNHSNDFAGIWSMIQMRICFKTLVTVCLLCQSGLSLICIQFFLEGSGSVGKF